MSDEKEKKGFSGLSSLASDVEAAPDTTRRQADSEERATEPQRDSTGPTPRSSAAKTKPAPSQRPEPEVVASGTSRTPTSGSSGAKWFWGLVGVGVLIWLFDAAQEDGNRSSSGRPYTQPSPSPRYTPPPVSPAQQPGLDFSKPPVGRNNVLSVAQIRWCLRQDIRVEVLRPMPETNAQIDQFNSVVSDYNSRCGSYRYRQGALARARREVEQQMAQIVENVSPPWQRRSVTSGGSAVQSVVPAPVPPRQPATIQPRAVQPSQLTLDIQSSLKALGYNPGPVDGLYGASTKSAIESFQRDAGIIPDGRVSQELLQRLRQESSARRTQSTKAIYAVVLERRGSTNSVASQDGAGAPDNLRRCRRGKVMVEPTSEIAILFGPIQTLADPRPHCIGVFRS